MRTGTPAAQAGIQPGDLITRLGNLQNRKWEDVEIKILITANEPIPVEIKRGDETKSFSIIPEGKGRDHIGVAGWLPHIPAKIDSVDATLPAGQAGLKPGDLIVADIDGVVVVPQAAEAEVVRRAWEKVHAENIVRDEIAGGLSATEAFKKYGVL